MIIFFQNERKAWLAFHKKKWEFQAYQRDNGQQSKKIKSAANTALRSSVNIQSFIQKAQRKLYNLSWQVVQVIETNTPGEFKLWALVNHLNISFICLFISILQVESELHLLKMRVPKIYYVNLRTPKVAEEGDLFKKCTRILPRSRPIYNLYRYSVPEELYRKHEK